MDRLLRPQYIMVALVTAVCLVLMTLVLPRFPDKACTCPLWALIFCEYLFALLVLIGVQFRELKESLDNFRISGALASVGVLFLVSAIGILVSPVAALKTDGSISIGLAQLTIMNFGILFSVIAISGVHQSPAENISIPITGSAEEVKGTRDSNINRLTKIRLKSLSKTHDELPPALDIRIKADEPYEEAAQLSEAIPIIESSSATLPDIQNISQSQEVHSSLVAEMPIQSPLQAPIQPSTPKKGHVSVQELMLRLRKPANKPSEDVITGEKTLVEQSAASPSAKMTTKEVPPEIRRLPSVNPKNQNKVFDKPHTSTMAKLQALSASGRGAVNGVPLASNTVGAEQTGLRSALNRIDNDEEMIVSGEHSSLSNSPSIATPIAKSTVKPVEPTNRAISAAAPASTPLITPSAEEREPKLFNGQVDGELENIFAGLAPAEAQREVSTNKGVSAVNDAPPTFASVSSPIPDNSGSLASDVSSIAEEEPKLFKGQIDGELEDIFAGLAPAEAQREVSSAIRTSNANIEEVTSFVPESPADPVSVPVSVPASDVSSIAEEEPKLFKGQIDGELEDIFAGLAPAEAQREVSTHSKVSSEIVEEVATFVAESPAPPASIQVSDLASSPEEETKLFKHVDGELEDIFAGLAPAEAQREVKDRIRTEEVKDAGQEDEITGERRSVNASLPHSLNEQKKSIPELKDFGRLSARASAEHESSTQAGTMKTIGKLLIDAQSVENIIKKADLGTIKVNLPSARVISLARGQGIQNLLQDIDNCQGVEGSMLVGEDGLVISSTYSPAGDRDGTGVLAHGMLGNSNLAMLRLDIGALEQIIMVSKLSENNQSKEVTTVLTDVEGGMLAVFANDKSLTSLDQLLDRIATIARG